MAVAFGIVTSCS